MGQLSHRSAIRQIVKEAPRPPSLSRPCNGTTLRGGHWTEKRDDKGQPIRRQNGRQWDYERVWVEAYEEPCGMGASAWITEVSFCSHHMPFELVAIGNARAELWASLCADIWAQVRADIPVPPELLEPEEAAP